MISQELISIPLPHARASQRGFLRSRSQTGVPASSPGLPHEDYEPPCSCPHLAAKGGSPNLLQVGGGGLARHTADAAHQRGTFGRRDHTAGIHQIKKVGTL